MNKNTSKMGLNSHSMKREFRLQRQMEKYGKSRRLYGKESQSCRTYRLNRQNTQIFKNIIENRKSLTRCMEHAEVMLNTSQGRVKKQKKRIERIIKGQRKLMKDEKEKWMKQNIKLFPNILKSSYDHEEKHYYRYKKAKGSRIEEFYLQEEPTLCLTDTFSTTRISASLSFNTTSKPQIILSGGINPLMNCKLLLHGYDKTENQWKDIVADGPGQPQFNISQHTTIQHKNTIYFIGGITVIPSHDKDNNDRYSIPFIPIFNMKTKKWDRINWGVYLRAHACAILGNHLIIHGGIDEEDKYNETLYLMDLESKSCPVGINIKSDKEMMCLAYHKMVSTQKVDPKMQEDLKVKGLLCFGGKNGKGYLNKSMLFYNCENKSLLDSDEFSKWTVLETTGSKPCGRFGHSMNILNTKTSYINCQAFCVVIGGINEKEEVLNDLWILDLFSLNWTNVEVLNSLNHISKYVWIQERGIAFHSTTSETNKIYILGGYDREMRCSTGFWSLNYEKGRGENKTIKVLDH